MSAYQIVQLRRPNIVVSGLVVVALLVASCYRQFWWKAPEISDQNSRSIVEALDMNRISKWMHLSRRVKFVNALKEFLTRNKTYAHLKLKRTRSGILTSEAMADEWIRQNLYGLIWPQSPDETNDRIEPQIKFLDVYQALKKAWGGVNKMKVIFGLGEFDAKSFNGQDKFIKDGCPKNWCITTVDRKYYKTADALLINHYPWENWSKAPKPPGQIWIAQHMESPRHNRINASAVKQLINWTLTYRRSSTVVQKYGVYKRAKTGQTIPPTTKKNYAANKTELVAMLVSNCYPSSNRKEYAKELAKYIPVHIYGGCGTMRCPESQAHNTRMSCVNWLGGKYKFYLAFENSRCKDYITEKFFSNSLGNDMLPIVLGASRKDYAAAAPPHSYIHVNDFKSPRHLAQYLIRLSRNDTLYNEYFAWRGKWTMIDEKYWCRLCTLLHLQSDLNYVHWYKDYATWWNGVCR